MGVGGIDIKAGINSFVEPIFASQKVNLDCHLQFSAKFSQGERVDAGTIHRTRNEMFLLGRSIENLLQKKALVFLSIRILLFIPS